MINPITLKSYTPQEIARLRTLPKLKPYLIKKNGDAIYFPNFEIMISKFQEDKMLHPDILDRELFESPDEYENYCNKKFSILNKNNLSKEHLNEIEKLQREKEEKEKEISELREQLMQKTIEIENASTIPTEDIDEDFIAAQTSARAAKRSSKI